jgi:uncharacterized protein
MNLKTRDFAFEVKSIEEDGTFSGYGSVFGVVDSYGEIVAPGAFLDSLAVHKTKGTMPALLWQHRSSEPLGVFTAMEEDSIGLKVSGQIALKTQRGAEAYELLKMKAISGLSIGFIPRDESRDKATGVVTLKRVDLWETSLVTFPANDAARVQGVKSIEEISDIRSLERHLRDVHGCSEREALAIISKAKSLKPSDSGKDGMQEAINYLRNLKTPL